MTRKTKTGKELTNAEIDELANEAETTDYDIDALKQRPSAGRPAMGSGPAEVVPVRIDPELREAINARAKADSTTTSAIIREAIRKFLDVA